MTTLRTFLMTGDAQYLLAQGRSFEDLKSRIEDALRAAGAFIDFIVVGKRRVSAFTPETRGWYTGRRWGKATGLRVAIVNLGPRRVNVRENAAMVNGAVVTGAAKTRATRSVPNPEFLEDLSSTSSALSIFFSETAPSRNACRTPATDGSPLPCGGVQCASTQHCLVSLRTTCATRLRALRPALERTSMPLSACSGMQQPHRPSTPTPTSTTLDYVAQALTSAGHAAVVQEQQERGAPTGPSAVLPLTPSSRSHGQGARGL